MQKEKKEKGNASVTQVTSFMPKTILNGKALSLEVRNMKALALGWESCRISKVSDLKRSSSSRDCLARVGERGSMIATS